MKFLETGLTGAFVVETEPHVDARGSFARTWCRREFEAQGLSADFVQGNRSINPHKGTLRGLHYQAPPDGEVKLIACARGKIFDVIVDLRPDSKTYRQWFSVELRPEIGNMLYVPIGFAHGFQTLTDDVEVNYLVTAYYTPTADSGVRFDDPALAIEWPLPVTRISDKDRTWPSMEVPIS